MNKESGEDESEGRTAPYVPFKTILTAVDVLKLGTPTTLDKGLFTTLSWAIQNQLMAALRFLGLIDQNDNVQESLRALVKSNDETRKPILRAILEQSYPEAFKLDLSHASPKQLQDIFKSHYSVEGDTQKKAVRFFLQAGKDAGIELSGHLRKKTRKASSGPRKRPQLPLRDESPANDQDGADAQPLHNRASSKTINLENAGTVTLTVNVDYLELTPEMHDWLKKVSEMFKGYQKDTADASK